MERRRRRPGLRGKGHELFAGEEERSSPPHGTALDLGCGAGIWAIELAKRGWPVTGVDIVPKALAQAEDRVAEEGGTCASSTATSRGAGGVLPDWRITDLEPSGFRLPKPLELVLKPNEHWYRLVRR